MPRYNVYVIGQPVLMEAWNTDEDGNLVNPVNPQILLRLPDGTETSLAVTEEPEGHIFHEYRVLAAGPYHYRIITADDALAGFFQVANTPFDDPLPTP